MLEYRNESYSEFFFHPGWKILLRKVEEICRDLEKKAAHEREDHPYKAGKLAGAEHVLSLLHRAESTKRFD